MGRKRIDDRVLLERWEVASESGVSMEDFAKSNRMSKKVLDNRLYRERKRQEKDAQDNKPRDVDDITDGNYRYLAAHTERIKTLDQLLEACKVDLNEWQVDDRYEVGTWEMGRRAENKKLTWKKGKITEGYSEDTGKLWIETLFRLRAVLVRKHPVPIDPLIQPVRFDFVPKKSEKPHEIKSGKALIVPDSQTGYRRDFRTGQLIPFHDRRAHHIIMQIAEYGNFDAIVYLGDGLDFTEWSDKFVTEPEFYYTTQPAIYEYAWFLNQMVTICPDAEHSLVLGNHEARLKNMLRKHMIAALQLKSTALVETEDPYSIEYLLGLSDLGIHFCGDYPNGEVWLGKGVRCVHTDGISSNPGGTVAKTIRDMTQTTLAAHNHSLEMATKTIDDADGIRYVVAATCGCLCHIDYRVPGHKRGQNWQQGFATVEYTKKSPTVELYPIIDGETTYHGKRFIGSDYADEVSKDTGWKF